MKHPVLRVGDGRGFAVRCRTHLEERMIVVTAAHCLPPSLPPREPGGPRQSLPSCHPWRGLDECTYFQLLGPLDGECTVAAECMFVDPMADIAVLGQPDNQELSDDAAAYDTLMEDLAPLTVVDAPAQGFELLTFEDCRVRNPTPGEGPARVLSLEGQWCEGRITRRRNMLAFEPRRLIVSGMSGSPIIDATGAAIGVVSDETQNPVIVDSLSTWLVHAIAAAEDEFVEAAQ